MLKREDLDANFSGVTDIATGIVRCKDVLPKVTYFNYVRLGEGDDDSDDLVISEGNPDDEFATAVLSCARSARAGGGLLLLDLPANKYGFEALLIAPSDYHSYFKGRLDDKRQKLMLCVPIYRCEFSGDESPEQFTTLRRDVVPILSWTRAPAPKIVLRFDNPKTRAGTGSRYVFAKEPLLAREVDNLDGVPNGFIELQNYKGRTVEIISPRLGVFTYIVDRDDTTRTDVDKRDLQKRLDDFLRG